MFYDFIVNEALPGTGLDAPPSGKALPVCSRNFRHERRIDGQARCAAGQDRCLASSPIRGRPIDAAAYQAFLREIGYLAARAGGIFGHHRRMSMTRSRTIAGPQLVVPVSNARYALNAANARWGSLYDALYGTDAISDEDGAAQDRRLQQGARGESRGARPGLSRRISRSRPAAMGTPGLSA